jgi:hypothetical protein
VESKESRDISDAFAAGCPDFARHHESPLKRIAHTHLRAEKIQAGVGIGLPTIG